MPRSKLPPRRQVHLRLPEDLYANLVLLRPELIDPTGQIRYGAMNAYFTKLVTRDVEQRLVRLAGIPQEVPYDS
jgi:hypothetical protein